MSVFEDTTEQQQQRQSIAQATEPPQQSGPALTGEDPEQQALESKQLYALQRSMPEQPAHVQEQYNYEPPQAENTVKAVTLLRPFKSDNGRSASVKLPKSKLVFELYTNGAPTPSELDNVLQVRYVKTKLLSKDSVPIKQLLQQKEDRYLLEYNLELPESFERGNYAEIDVFGTTFRLTYYPIDTPIETPTEAKKAIDKFKGWSHDQLTLYSKPEQLQALLPDFKFETSTNGMPQANMANLITAIEQQATFSEPIDEAELEGQEAKELLALKIALMTKKSSLENLLQDNSRYAEVLANLPQNYEGGQEQQVFGAAYQQIIAQNSQAKTTLLQYTRRYSEEITLVEKARQDARVQEAMSPALSAEKQRAEETAAAIDQQLQQLKEQSESLTSRDQDFEAWKNELRSIREAISQLQVQWTTTFQTLQAAVELFETEQPQPNGVYKDWKRYGYRHLQQQSETIELYEKSILKNLKAPQETLDLTGGDGALEYKEGENKVDDTERARFGQDGRELSFKTPKATLNLDNISPSDITQQGVGDCYLLACLATLAQSDTADLIRNAIVEKAGYYEVTLYKNKVPVKVGVDKAMLHVNKEFADGRYIDSYLGADPEQGLWVAIIEKAYAKIEGGGEEADYSKIEQNHTQYAFDVLLGPKQQSPDKIYLDEAGNLSEQATERAFKNPLPLQKTSPEDIAALAQACTTQGYKMTVASPDNFDGVEGLTHDHVVKIDGANYMHLNHAYAVMDADANRITLLNPHGEKAGLDRQSYSPELEEKAAHLEEVLKELSKELEDSKHKTFSQDSKKAMQQAFDAFYLDNAEDNQEQGYDDRTLKKLYRVWNRIINKAELQGELWRIDRKNIKNVEKNLLPFTEAFIKSEFKKGFKAKAKLDIKATQTIPYDVTAETFSELVVFKINK